MDNVRLNSGPDSKWTVVYLFWANSANLLSCGSSMFECETCKSIINYYCLLINGISIERSTNANKRKGNFFYGKTEKKKNIIYIQCSEYYRSEFLTHELVNKKHVSNSQRFDANIHDSIYIYVVVLFSFFFFFQIHNNVYLQNVGFILPQLNEKSNTVNIRFSCSTYLTWKKIAFEMVFFFFFLVFN